MPVWERNCPKCGRPMKVDTQSSKLYCPYCNEQFWTDEFLNNRTKYSKPQKNKKTSWLDLLSSSSDKSKKSSSDKQKGTELDLLILLIIITFPFALLLTIITLWL